MRAAVVLGVFAVAVLAAGAAAAEKKRVGVPRFDGPQEAVVRKAVMQVLKGQGYDVVGSRELDGAAKSAGASLDSNDGFKAVAKELSIASFVTGEVSKKKAKLTVRNGADGFVTGEGSFAGATPAKLAAEVRDGFARRLGSAVDRGRAPSGAKKPAAAPVAEAEEGGDETGGGEEPAPRAAAASRKTETAAPPPSDESSEGKAPEGGESTEGVVAKKAPEPEEAGAVGPRALDISAGFRGFTRNLSYNDVLSQSDPRYALREYHLVLGPAVNADIIAYPAAFSTGGFAANLGVEVHLEQAFGVASNVPAMAGTSFPNGATFPTVIHDFSGGVRVRFPIDAGSEIAVLAGYGEQAFAFRSGGVGEERSKLDIPDTIYRYARVGAEARIVMTTGLTLGIGGAYRHVLNRGGQISEVPFFPYLTVRGMDLNAKLGYQITPSFEARFTVDLRRYGYAMHSDPSDVMPPNMNKVAGGAVDQYLGFGLGVAYVFGGVAPGAVSEEPAAEEAPKKHKKKKKKKAEASEDESGGEGGGEGGGGEGGGDDSDQ